ncbi:MAG: hypothetical protein JXQ71_17670 [Verrucomicrobia bacterium]|nr:hypothetical protein [Verrucomicrobiota bacterium]
MPTTVPITPTREPGLWTAESFLEWLKPGVHADLVDGERLMHRFFFREGDGEILAEFGQGADRVSARAVPGFWVKRAWLNPDALPEVAPSLAEILAAS